MFLKGNLMDNTISFTSLIKPVSSTEFRRQSSRILNSVDEWDLNGLKKGMSAKTDRIMDCTAMGITDGENVVLLHIVPNLSSDKNYFAKIAEKVKKSINMTSEYLQGILVGAKKYSRESLVGYNNFVKFLKENKIPFSELKGGESVHKIAYSSDKDTWLVSNFDIDTLLQKGLDDSKKLLEFGFDKVKISKFDEID